MTPTSSGNVIFEDGIKGRSDLLGESSSSMTGTWKRTGRDTQRTLCLCQMTPKAETQPRGPRTAFHRCRQTTGTRKKQRTVRPHAEVSGERGPSNTLISNVCFPAEERANVCCSKLPCLSYLIRQPIRMLKKHLCHPFTFQQDFMKFSPDGGN